jgi:hypothetical protein
MRTETFLSIMREISRDPLTDRQKAEIAEQDKERIIDTKEAAELLGMSTITLRRIKQIPRIRTNRRNIHYRLADVMAYRNKLTF